MGTIDIGHEVELHVAVAIWFEGFRDHDGAAVKHESARTRNIGAAMAYRSEPPIPILMMVVSFLPVYPFHDPLLTCSENSFMCSSTELVSSTTLLPSTCMGYLATFLNATW